jgi:hypothetical protein
VTVESAAQLMNLDQARDLEGLKPFFLRVQTIRLIGA